MRPTFRSGGQFTSSKAPDAQAAYESAHTLLPTLQAGVNFVLHAAGWLEGSLALSYEKLILDADQFGAGEESSQPGPRPPPSGVRSGPGGDAGGAAAASD